MSLFLLSCIFAGIGLTALVVFSEYARWTLRKDK